MSHLPTLPRRSGGMLLPVLALASLILVAAALAALLPV